MDWRRWASIARLTIRKMSCLNGSKKLLTQKIMRVDTETRLWARLFSARSAFLCKYWTCSFSCRNNQAIGPRLSAFSPSFISHICLSNCNGYFGRKMPSGSRIFLSRISHYVCSEQIAANE